MVDASTVRGRGSRRQQLPEEVASYVRELIISGEVRPGEFLRMEPIAEAVGVSNTPVREGLLSLRSEGFVELVPRRGFVVASFTRQDVRDLFWAQAQLAGELGARAAKTITSDQLAVLETNVADYERAFDAGDQAQLAELGHQFHRQINLAANSHRLALLLGTVVSQLPNRFYAQIEGHVGGTREAHPRILDAIRKRASRQVRSLISEHILEGGEQLVGMLEERGMWADSPSTS
ncbi:GntR family transcriptional regulator [Amycolatopsis acidicola]|uniref:GntR family transcriptional regulator n=1 Tax=Amycolatopsis acidicola TaxID=2596893 RepID=A0A5N0VA44_9PSEU|nr:GntR family transcriptional regulator [Amycolatopsis acidicola]KAA9163257.1 GntR family transcriptional regulator [Amycolatopsis acidicola]